MEKSISRETLSAITSLPPLPEIVRRFQKLKEENKIDRADIVREVQNDPAVIAGIMKIARSPIYNIKNEDLGFIVSFLGFPEIFKIVFAISAKNILKTDDVKYQKSFWKHSYATAIWTNIIARDLNISERYIKRLWVPAMLHDIGKIVYLIIREERFKKLLKKQKEQRCLFSEIDGNMSSLMGFYLAISWDLPGNICGIIKKHTINYVTEVKRRDTKELVCLANLFACLQFDTLNEQIYINIIERIGSNMCCDETKIEKLISDNNQFITDEINSLL